ncbi:hypothetical protein F5884DRAFT_862057 [Xylogone sp. PMI_703]|nr:hypothetical protein F5884DRAFT_862057 [Xylogone sp. PMI_703]
MPDKVDTVESISELPPVKTHIASFDANGKSIYISSPPQQYFVYPNVAGVSRSYSVESIPAKLAKEGDAKGYLSNDGPTSWTLPHIASREGANLFVTDILPGAVSQMHRTVSLDFAICIAGELDHELDSGERVRLNPGDHIIQRGTFHRWINPSKTEPARFIATTLACEPFEIGGKMLQEEYLPDEPTEKLDGHREQ